MSDIPVVLSVSRLAQPVTEAPGAITVIDRDMIRASGARALPDVFRLVPGFLVGYDNGHFANVTYHGLGDQYARRMQVLIDGRSVYTPLFGGVEWADLPLALEDIERIEVIRGPNAATYGANSFLGVINILTRHAAEDRGTRVSLLQGNKGTRDAYARHGDHAGGLDYRLTVGYRGDNGFDALHDTTRSGLVNVRGDYRLNTSDALQAQWGYTDGSRDAGEITDRSVDRAHAKYVSSNYLQLRWQRATAPDREISVQYYRNYHQSHESFDTDPLSLPRPFNVPLHLDMPITAERNDLEFQHVFSPAANWRTVWGASARHDSVTAPHYFATPDAQTTRLLRLFGNAEWRATPRLLLNGGAMLEKHSLTGGDISPRLAVNYTLAPGQSLRASVSKALRTPVMLEEKANLRFTLQGQVLDQVFLAKGGLRPERILSREVGYVADWPSLGAQLDVRAFNDQLQDLIDSCVYDLPANSELLTTPVPSTCTTSVPARGRKAFTFRNLDRAAVRGWEMQSRFSPWSGGRILLSYARVRIESDNLDEEYSASAPSHSLSALWSQRFGQALEGSLAYYVVGAFDPLGSEGDPRGMTRRLDARLAHRVTFGGTRGEAALVIQNLLKSYPEFGEGAVFDTRYFFNLTFEL